MSMPYFPGIERKSPTFLEKTPFFLILSRRKLEETQTILIVLLSISARPSKGYG